MDSSDPFDAVREFHNFFSFQIQFFLVDIFLKINKNQSIEKNSEVKDTLTKIKALYERYQEILHSLNPNSPPYVREEMLWFAFLTFFCLFSQYSDFSVITKFSGQRMKLNKK